MYYHPVHYWIPLLKQNDLMMHARQKSGRAYPIPNPGSKSKLFPKVKVLEPLTCHYIWYHCHNVHCHDHRYVAFKRRGKLCLFSIWYFICVTKYINSMVSPFLRIICGPISEITCTFLLGIWVTTSTWSNSWSFLSVFYTFEIIKKNTKNEKKRKKQRKKETKKERMKSKKQKQKK